MTLLGEVESHCEPRTTQIQSTSDIPKIRPHIPADPDSDGTQGARGSKDLRH